MNPKEPYTFRMEQTSYKSQDLIYEEPGHRLKVYLEMSGVRQYDWLGSDTDFGEWTEPAGEPISEARRNQILDRLAEWGRRNKVRIDISPPIDMAEYFADMERKGWTREHRPDGTQVFKPPPTPVWRPIALGALFGCLMGIGQIFGTSNHLLLAGVAYVIGFIGWSGVLARVNGPGKVTLQGVVTAFLFLGLWLLVPWLAGKR
jgi:hypothetical protein